MMPLDRWYDDLAASPVGSLLLFLLVFLARMAMDKHSTKRRHKREAQRADRKAPS